MMTAKQALAASLNGKKDRDKEELELVMYWINEATKRGSTYTHVYNLYSGNREFLTNAGYKITLNEFSGVRAISNPPIYISWEDAK